MQYKENKISFQIKKTNYSKTKGKRKSKAQKEVHLSKTKKGY